MHHEKPAAVLSESIVAADTIPRCSAIDYAPPVSLHFKGSCRCFTGNRDSKARYDVYHVCTRMFDRVDRSGAVGFTLGERASGSV